MLTEMLLKDLQVRVSRLEEQTKGEFKRYPRDSYKWTLLEKDILDENLESLVKRLSKEYGRTSNALWWAISRTCRERRF